MRPPRIPQVTRPIPLRSCHIQRRNHQTHYSHPCRFYVRIPHSTFRGLPSAFSHFLILSPSEAPFSSLDSLIRHFSFWPLSPSIIALSSRDIAPEQTDYANTPYKDRFYVRLRAFVPLWFITS